MSCFAMLFAASVLCGGCTYSGQGNQDKKQLTPSEAEYITFYGRDDITEEGATLYNGASGFGVRFSGTELRAVMRADGEWDCRLSVLIDGETDSNKKIVSVYYSGEYVLANGLSDGEHVAYILKRTDSLRNTLYLTNLSTDGRFLSAPARSEWKIDFFGDSITMGSGILREISYDEKSGKYSDSGIYTVDTQNALQSYAFVAAEQLGAEVSYYGRGGITLALGSGYTMLNNPDALAVDLDAGSFPYDYEGADAVVIYLGTNDYLIGSKKESSYSSDWIKTMFLRFLRQAIRTRYSADIPVFLCSGLMVPESGLSDVLTDVKCILKSEFPNLETVEFSPCKIGHPVASENETAGLLLAEAIRKQINS